MTKAFIFIWILILGAGTMPNLAAQGDELLYEENFETAGGSLPAGWKANASAPLIGIYSDWSNKALYMVPEGEHLTLNASLSQNLSGKDHVFVTFKVATLKNGSAEDRKRTKLSVSVSSDGGRSFSFGMKIGPEMGLDNVTSPFQTYLYPLPPTANGQSRVVIRFNAKASGGPHLAAKLLIDDVKVWEAPRDRFAPFMWGEVTPSSLRSIRLNFSEPLALLQAENKSNYTFSAAEDPAHRPYVSPPTQMPMIASASVINNGYSVLLKLSRGIEQGEYYTFYVNNITDLAGNADHFVLDNFVHNVPDPGDLIFSEVLFNDPSGAHPMQKLQFVEIYNPTNKAVPLGGLRIKGAISAHNMPNVHIYPGQFWVVTRNAEAFEQTFGFPVWEWKGSWIQYDESHEGEPVESQELYIQTTDHHGASYVDHITFDFSDPEWGALNEPGRSMELCDLSSDNSRVYNWVLADDSGTPYRYQPGSGGVTYDLFATPETGRTGNSVCGTRGEKVIVCHKTARGYEEICIDPWYLPDHLRHGDVEGPCDSGCDNNVGFRSESGENTLPVTDTYLTVTPNPVREAATIDISPDLGVIQFVEVLGLDGKQLRQMESADQARFSFDTTGLSAGVYVLRINTDLGSYTRRIVIQ